MKIVILGGGLTGLTAAYYLSQAPVHPEIVIIEKGERVGGLAGGFKKAGWNWELERTYHHIFSNDEAILSLAKQIQFHSFEFSSPITASLFGEENNYRIFPVDSPKDFLVLPVLSFISKLRAGLTLLFLKVSPHLSLFEKTTASRFLKQTMGREVWITLWEQLFVKKFGNHADSILASFIWARIHKRTQNLGYPKGGFQFFVDALADENRKRNVSVHTSTSVQLVEKREKNYRIQVTNSEGKNINIDADIVLSTLPYPITNKTMNEVLGERYVVQQSKRKYLFAINLILSSKKPILPKIYWLNIGAKDIPIMCMVQHTNFVNSKEYGGVELCYVAWYVDSESELLQKTEGELLNFVLPYLKKINPHLEEVPKVAGHFIAPYAQPIFDAEFLAIPRSFSAPAKNIYVANMDMTYPYDRGTNYAVQIGKDVSSFILKNLQ